MEPITTIGEILTGNENRDAIHFAVAPVIAGEPLKPGQHIGLIEGEAGGSDQPIGIVDPFLRAPVAKGEKFWMFLYPNTITSLRHEWVHPAFEAGRISRDDHVAKSQKWIAQHANDMGLSADVLMEQATDTLSDTSAYPDYIVQQGSERWRDTFSPTEFWHHYEVVTGRVVPEEKKQSFYCCTC